MQGQMVCSSLPSEPSGLGVTLLDPLMMLETLSCPSSALSDSASHFLAPDNTNSLQNKTPATQSRSASSLASPSVSPSTPTPPPSSGSSKCNTQPSTSKQQTASGHPDDRVAISVYALPLFKEASGEPRYAFIPVRDLTSSSVGHPSSAYHPTPPRPIPQSQHHPPSAPPNHPFPPASNPPPSPSPSPSPSLSPSTSNGVTGFLMQRMEHASAATRSTWDAWGRMDKRTWLRWLHDMGQTITEDVSPEARLARGISSKASRVTVYHPSSLPQDQAHRQITSIVSSRSRSELWRMIGFMAFLPVGVVLDHTVFIAVPGPLTSGYSSYKSYIYYKGTRGSMRMQQLIHGYEQQQRQGAGAGAATAGPARQASDAGSAEQGPVQQQQQQAPGHAACPAPAATGFPSCSKRSVNFGSQCSGSGLDLGVRGLMLDSFACSMSDGDVGIEALRPAPRARSASGAMELGACPAAGGAPQCLERGGGGDGQQGGAGRVRERRSMEGSGVFALDDVESVQQQQQQQQQQVPGQDCSEQQGLVYAVLPGLSSFVEVLRDAPGDVLPEEAAQQLVLLLPPAHRQEVARHIAELRRRHARHQRQQAPRHAEQELVDRLTPHRA